MNILRYRYQTLDFGKNDIHVRSLKDRNQFADEDKVAEKLGISEANWPLFGVIWPAGEFLAHLMQEQKIKDLKILEVGCGIALASLVLNHRLANITATDYHPEVNEFLQGNAKLNDDKEIPFVRTGWEDEKSLLGKFDLIIGSDVLYERCHVNQLASFIEQHSEEHCEVILIDPGRGHHAPFSKKMVSLGYSHSQSKHEQTELMTQNFVGQVLRYKR